MRVSFKVSKTGTRWFRPPPHHAQTDHPHVENAHAILNSGADAVDATSERDISFTLSLYPNGYLITKPSEDEHVQTCVDIPMYLHPYDRASEPLFSAIESGHLPGCIVDDIPCKYIDGSLVCEVRDYRNCFSESGVLSSADTLPVINKVLLKMSLESVVKDIPSLSDSSWTYGDLLELESRILKAIQPKLCLDPTSKLDNLCDDHISSKLTLDWPSMRTKRLRQTPEVTVTVNSRTVGKKIRIDKMPENSRMGDAVSVMQHPGSEHLSGKNNGPVTNNFGSESSLPTSPLVPHPSKYQMGIVNPRLIQDHRSGPVMTSTGASLSGQDIMMSSPLSNLSRRERVTSTGVDGKRHNVGPHMDSNWKNTLSQDQMMARSMQNANNAMPKYPQQMLEGYQSHEVGTMAVSMGKQGLRGNLKEEPVGIEAVNKTSFGQTKHEMLMTGSQMSNMNGQPSGLQQRLPQRRSHSRTEESFKKRNLSQSPRVSAGGLPQSTMSSKSGEYSSGSAGPQFGNVAASGLVASQKEKSSGATIGGTSLTSSTNDSMQHQQHTQMATKRMSSSLPKSHAMSGVGSPVSVSNITCPIKASCPNVGSSSLPDQSMLARWSMIDMVAARFQLDRKKSKVDGYPIQRSKVYISHQLSSYLSSDLNNESYEDEKYDMPLSRSLVGGSMNACKLRVMNCALPEQVPQGTSFSVDPEVQTRLIMSENPNDGTVALYIGEIDNTENIAAEEGLPILPNTHTADMLAAQFCQLMTREGYNVEDHVQINPISGNRSSSSQLSFPGISPSSVSRELHPYSEGVSSQPSIVIANPSNTNNITASSPQNMQGMSMTSSANAQPLQISQGMNPGGSMSPRPQQVDPLSTLPQQKLNQRMSMRQHPRLKRSHMMLSANQMSHLSTMGQNTNIQMANKHSPQQLQMLQQKIQQQQQRQARRKMMMSLGNVGGIDNIGNGMAGLGGVINMGGVRGVGATGISAPMGSMSCMGNVAQIPVNQRQASNIGNAIRSGMLTPAEAALMMEKLRMASAQAAVMEKMRMERMTNMLINQHSVMGGMAGARQQMHGGAAGMSMLNHTPNRGTFSPMQQTGIDRMRPPMLMPGKNGYTPQKLQFQQHQMQQQHQDIPQAIQTFSSSQVRSPSDMGLPQQMNQQFMQQQLLQQATLQQMSQGTPMSPQLSSGATHSMSVGNLETCPPSPQSSSQALGLVGR